MNELRSRLQETAARVGRKGRAANLLACLGGTPKVKEALKKLLQLAPERRFEVKMRAPHDEIGQTGQPTEVLQEMNRKKDVSSGSRSLSKQTCRFIT